MTIRDAWEAEARNWIAWARRPGHDSYWQFHREIFLASLPPPPARVVDVGCGEGRVDRDLKALGYEVTGIDGSPTMVEAAREADPQGEYLVADACRSRTGAPTSSWRSCRPTISMTWIAPSARRRASSCQAGTSEWPSSIR